MTKTELMETYTMEQLAEMVVEKERFIEMVREFNIFKDIKASGLFDDPVKGYYETNMSICESNVKVLEKKLVEKESRINHLQSEVEKYRKAFEDAKNERDCQIAECKKKIDELNAENSELNCELQAVNAFQEGYPTEPIKVADMLINATYTREKGDVEKAFCKALGNNSDMVEENVFDISELRQIAEHLLVYCNHNGEVEK